MYGRKRQVIPKEAEMKREAIEKRQADGHMASAIREKAEAFFGTPYVECHGWRRVTVGGAKKIESMEKERVVVLLDRGKLAICGAELICVSFRNGSLTVVGAIDSVGKWGKER